MQKLAIGLETHIVAKESKSRRKQKSKTNPVTSWEKQENGILENSQVENEEKLDAIILKRTETRDLEKENNGKVKEKLNPPPSDRLCGCIIF
ncbi:unnamed protein product [Blepharisma stoltei]|uniref:Uncharacterized protein n=1 Tax=Blepharisma stoltei TaxID=1481888 RepID=A0AAU9J4L1_9CILI|nr:unnamed protein product [Blepharisma stoltei]